MADSVPTSSNPGEVIELGRYRLDLWRKVVHCGDKCERLIIPEAVALRAIGEASGLVNWPYIARELAKYDGTSDTDYDEMTVRSYVCRLRKKLKRITTLDNPIPNKIKSGYKLV